MLRPTKNSERAHILDSDSELEELETTPTDVGGVSTALAPAVTYQRSDEPTEAQKKRFEDTWKFQTFVDELEKDTAKPKTKKAKVYFNAYFKAVPTFTSRTLLLFERWAGLVNNINSRSDQMRELVGLLHGRWDGHRGKGISIGKDRMAKDGNLRSDLLELLEKRYPHEDFRDFRVEAGNEGPEDAEETAVAQSGETPATEHALQLLQRTRPRQQSTLITTPHNGITQASKPRDAAPANRSPEERRVLERTILANWADHPATVTDHLPGFIGPVSSNWTDWSFDVLEAVVNLSSVTRARESEAIFAKLQELAPDAKTYSRLRSLSVLNTARDYFDNGKGVQPQPDQQVDSPAGANLQPGEKKRPGSQPPSGQRPQKHPRAAASNHATAHAGSSRARTQPPHTITTQPATPTETLHQPHDTNTLKMPPGLSNSDQIRYHDLSFDIMKRDSQRCEAERQVERAMAARSLACLNDGNRALAALEAKVGEQRVEVEKLRGNVVALRVRRGKIAAVGREDAARESGEVGENGGAA